jgi:hypothetical protein
MCWRYLLLRQRLLPTRSYGGALFSFNTAATATRRIIKIYKLVFHTSNSHSYEHNSGNTDMDGK